MLPVFDRFARTLQFLLILALAGILFFANPLHAQQLNLANQVRGVLAPVNGGTGLNTSQASGCLQFAAGVPSIGTCGGGGVTSFNGRAGGVTLQGSDTLAAYGNQAAHVVCGAGPGSGTGAVTCRTMTLDEFGPAFGITGFSCDRCGNYEIGATVSSPTSFTASYTSTPNSVGISDGTNSVALASPYTNGSLAYSYTSTTQSTTTFTLTAVAATTRTATQGISWYPRVFGGVGSAGATGATAAGNNAALTGATGTLSSAGLGNQGSYGPFSPSAQVIYLLLVGAGHTFKDQNNVAFPMTSMPIPFTNQYGPSVPNEYLYFSGVLSSPYTLSQVN